MSIKSFLLTFAAAAFFALPVATHAETNKTLGSFDTAGTAADIIVVGNYAYVADGSNGIVTLNVTSTTPTLASTVALDGAQRLDASGTNLFVASTTLGFRALSLADPVTPVITGSYTQAGLTIVDVATDGTYVYLLGVLNGQSVIEVLDISTPAAPVYKTTLNVSVGNDLVLSANYVYLVGGGTLQVINAYPILTIAGTYTDPSASASYQGVQIYGSIAYINDNVLGLHAVNIANPAAMTVVFESATQFPATGFGMGLSISNGYVFLTRTTSGGLAIYDVTSTSTPSYIDMYSGSAGANGMTVANDIAYIATGAAGIQLLDVSHPDVVPPVVTPVGSITPVVNPGAKYTDPGVTTDSGVVVVSGKVDTGKVGRYVLTYTVTDRAGNVTKITRTVIVGPSVEKLVLKNNTYTLKVGKRNVVLRPFVGYRGAVLGRKLIVNTKTDPLYVFIATDAMRKPELVVYNASGKVTTRQNLTTISTKGLQVEIVSNPATLSVFYAVAPKANGLTATIFNLSKSGFKSLKTVTAAKGKATLVMKWLKGYTNEYILATLVKGKLDTPAVWRYNGSKKSFVRDTKFDTLRLLWTKTTVKLK